jgi:hypothetical protein
MFYCAFADINELRHLIQRRADAGTVGDVIVQIVRLVDSVLGTSPRVENVSGGDVVVDGGILGTGHPLMDKEQSSEPRSPKGGDLVYAPTECV